MLRESHVSKNTPVPQPDDEEFTPLGDIDQFTLDAMMAGQEQPDLSGDPQYMSDTDEHDTVDITKIPTQPLK